MASEGYHWKSYHRTTEDDPMVPASLVLGILKEETFLFHHTHDRFFSLLSNVVRFIGGKDRLDARKALVNNLIDNEDDIAACCFVLVQLFLPNFAESFNKFQATQLSKGLPKGLSYEEHAENRLLRFINDRTLKALLITSIPEDYENRIRLACDIIVECENIKEKHRAEKFVNACMFEPPHREVAVKFGDNSMMSAHLQKTAEIVMDMPLTESVEDFRLLTNATLRLLAQDDQCHKHAQDLERHRHDKERVKQTLTTFYSQLEDFPNLSPKRIEVVSKLISTTEKKVKEELSAFYQALYFATESYVVYQRSRASYYCVYIAGMSFTLRYRILLDAFLLWAAYYDAGSGTPALQLSTRFYETLGFVLKKNNAVSGVAAVAEAAKADMDVSLRWTDTEIYFSSRFINSILSTDFYFQTPKTPLELLRSMLLCKDGDDGDALVAEAPPPGNVIRTTHAYSNGTSVYSGYWDKETETPCGHGTLSLDSGKLKFEGEFYENGGCDVKLVESGPNSPKAHYVGPLKDGTLTGDNGVFTITEAALGTVVYNGTFENGVLVDGDKRSADSRLISQGTYDPKTKYLTQGKRYNPPGTLSEEGTFEDSNLVKGKKYDATGSVIAVLKKATFANGNIYDGEWNKDGSKPKGNGTLSLFNEGDDVSFFDFKGIFKEDGTCNVADGDARYIGKFENGKLTEGTMNNKLTDGMPFTDTGVFDASGEMRLGTRYVGNTEFEGTFKDGSFVAGKIKVMNEKGDVDKVLTKFTYDSGHFYIGEWNESKKTPEGQGELWLMGVSVQVCYEGRFYEDGTCDVKDKANHCHYIGKFENGRFTNGTLTAKLKDEVVLTDKGDFYANGHLKRGTRSTNAGTIVETGLWENGCLVDGTVTMDDKIHRQGRFENDKLVPGLKVPYLAMYPAHWETVLRVMGKIPHRELACDAISNAKAGADDKFEVPNLALYNNEWKDVLTGLEGQKATQAAAAEAFQSEHAAAADKAAASANAADALRFQQNAAEAEAKTARNKATRAKKAALASKRESERQDKVAEDAATAAEKLRSEQAAAAEALRVQQAAVAAAADAAATEREQAKQLGLACNAIRAALGIPIDASTAEATATEGATSWPQTISQKEQAASKEQKRSKWLRKQRKEKQGSPPPVMQHDPDTSIILTPDHAGTGLECSEIKTETLSDSKLYDGKVSRHDQATQEYTDNWRRSALAAFKHWFNSDVAATCRNGLDSESVNAALDDCFPNIFIAHVHLKGGAKHRRAFFARIHSSGIKKLQQTYHMKVPKLVCIVFAIGHHYGKDNLHYQTCADDDYGVAIPGEHWQVDSKKTKHTRNESKTPFDGNTFHFVGPKSTKCAFADA